MKSGLYTIIFCLYGLCSCASPSLQVRSAPDGADVTFIGADGAARTLGKTPLMLEAAAVPGLFSEAGQIQVSKEGYTPQSALVPKLGLGGTGRLNFLLGHTELPKVCQAGEDVAGEIARGVAESTSLIQRKRYADASGILRNLIEKYPKTAVLYDLKGNVEYLQRDLTRALEAFKQSNHLAPNNSATMRMIERIQNMQGGQP